MSVYNFKGINAFLRHHIAHLPKNGRGEISRIAQQVDVSTSLVSQVLAGQKTLTPEQTQKLIEYLGLVGLEADYITFLNQKERAGSKVLENFWQNKIEEIRQKSLQISARVKSDKALTSEQQSIFYSSLFYSAVRLYTSVGDHGKSIDEICERFDISRVKANTVLNFLVETGLCVEKNQKFFLGSQKTHLEKNSPYMLRHLGNCRLSAIQQIESLSDEELMYSATVSLSENDFYLLREEMVEFIKKFLNRVHSSPSEEVACLNLDFFWIK